MKKMEIEFKAMINEIDFKILKDSVFQNPINYFEQENVYYDTEKEDLKKTGLALRIRYINNKKIFIATLKVKEKVGHLEHEYLCEGYENFPSGIKDELSKYSIDISALKEIARLKTYRYEVMIDNSLLCLDKSEAYGNVDYEIECEADSMDIAKEIVNKLSFDYNIKLIETKKSKLARAKEYKKNSL